MPSKVAIIEDSLSIDVRRSEPIATSDIDVSEQKLFYSLLRSVEPNTNKPHSVNNEQTVTSGGSFSVSTSSVENSDAFGVHDETDSSFRHESTSMLSTLKMFLSRTLFFS